MYSPLLIHPPGKSPTCPEYIRYVHEGDPREKRKNHRMAVAAAKMEGRKKRSTDLAYSDSVDDLDLVFRNTS